GKEKEACLFILDCVSGQINHDPRLTVKRRFRIHGRRCRYLIKYVEILARSSFWEILENEREIGVIPPEWAASGGILRTFS
ncbi:MAG: hypothetical protein MJA83_00550, partial [Gammaproteobacteria bacterium]|nr:hypothetical protein [Gammaproteobacteria bacterium]